VESQVRILPGLPFLVSRRRRAGFPPSQLGAALRSQSGRGCRDGTPPEPVYHRSRSPRPASCLALKGASSWEPRRRNRNTEPRPVVIRANGIAYAQACWRKNRRRLESAPRKRPLGPESLDRSAWPDARAGNVLLDLVQRLVAIITASTILDRLRRRPGPRQIHSARLQMAFRAPRNSASSTRTIYTRPSVQGRGRPNTCDHETCASSRTRADPAAAK
jgi:hypothetical protein